MFLRNSLRRAAQCSKILPRTELHPRRPSSKRFSTRGGASSSYGVGRASVLAFGIGTAVFAALKVSSLGQAVRLDAPEGGPSVRRLGTPETLADDDAVRRAEEFLQAKETEALEESSTIHAVPTPEAEEGESEGGGGAFNPETGEINWDCPCLGGMAHGPCGQEFRAAFSCFVFSEEEPKGINCVELFKTMQDCFREHPEVYGEEIMNDDEDDAPSPGAEPETPSSSEQGVVPAKS